MAKQLNLLNSDRIIPTPLHTEMQRSYLEYAMSVIIGRALPDVRDGLKPVHRRIIYAMHELGLTPDRPYRKCARVVGDVLGKYHPHGDQSVYDALVRLVQTFSTRYPLLDGHGNFGSVDDDPAAAMRYTETRLAPIAQLGLLTEIGESTVDFTPNFDNSQQEPTVLPAQLPILLLNGCSGIAVGMATNIPPHNLGEVIDGLIALIDNPQLSDQELLKLIPGPDFPTGGEIVGHEGIREAYLTGKGTIPLRGVVNIEEITRHKKTRVQNRTALIITELPYQVNKSAWIEKVADLVNDQKIEGIADIRDESDREGMRVVIELKRDTNPQVLIEQLYRQTSLQINFGAILLAIADNQPRQLTLRQLLELFLQFREETVTKQYEYELGEKQRRLHIVDGLLIALRQVDQVIDILRNAADGATAKVNLQQRLNISDSQADAILAMPLRRITGLETKNLQTEANELQERINFLQTLLGDRHELLKELKKDLRSIKRKFADARRTKLIVNHHKNSPVASQKETSAVTKQAKTTVENTLNLAQPQEVILEFTYKGYVRKFPKNDSKHSFKNSDDVIVKTKEITTDKELIVISKSGKAYPLKIADIPLTANRSKGTPLLTLLPNSLQSEFANNPQEAIANYFFIPDKIENLTITLISQQGKIKRLPISEVQNLTNRGMTLIKLKEDDSVKNVRLTRDNYEVIIATTAGRMLRFPVNEQQIPVMGKTAQGSQATSLRQKEQLIGCVTISPNKNILLISEQGYAKKLAVKDIRSANRGDIGTQVLQFSSKTDRLTTMLTATLTGEVILITSNQRIVKVPIENIKTWGKDGTGDRIIDLNNDEKIINVFIRH
jgi:DNA gyrase subunit A